MWNINAFHILVINFTADASRAQFDSLIQEDAPIFAKIDGLIHKHFIFNHEEKTYGGVHMFESKGALQAYMDREIYESVIETPYWSNHLARHYDVHADVSNIQDQIKRH